MATVVSFNGANFTIPGVGERNFGQNLTNYFVAIAAGALTKAGGNASLTADLNLGTSFGVIAKYLKSSSPNIAASGVLRLANLEGVTWRNAANNGDLSLVVDALDRLTYNGSVLATSTDVAAKQPLDGDLTAISALATTGLAKRTGTDTWSLTSARSEVGLTTKGDLLADTGSALVRVPVGANGTVLTADSAQPSGLAYTSPLTNPMSAVGDLIYGATSGTATRLAPNTTTTRKFLSETGTGSAGQAPVWDEGLATSSTSGTVAKKARGSFTATLTGAFNSSVTIQYALVDGVTTLSFPAISVASVAATTINIDLTNMPAHIRPIVSTMDLLQIRTISNTVDVGPGYLRLPASGNGLVQAGTSTTFAATGFAGWNGFSVSYTAVT